MPQEAVKTYTKICSNQNHTHMSFRYSENNNSNHYSLVFISTLNLKFCTNSFRINEIKKKERKAIKLNHASWKLATVLFRVFYISENWFFWTNLRNVCAKYKFWSTINGLFLSPVICVQRTSRSMTQERNVFCSQDKFTEQHFFPSHVLSVEGRWANTSHIISSSTELTVKLEALPMIR